MKPVLLAGALLCTLSCGSATGVFGGELSVRVTPPILNLTNHTTAAVYFFAIEGQSASRANWAPCTDPSHCAAVAPAASRDLPYSQIAGYELGVQTAIVYWWHLIPGGETGFHPDSVRAVGVRL